MSDKSRALRDLTDEELIGTFQQGELEGFNILVGRYKDAIVNFAYRYLGDYDEADDIAQETFLRVYYKKHTYRPIAKFSTWLYTIATNLAKTQLRRRRRHGLFSVNRKGGDDRNYEIPDDRDPADARADSSLKQEIIQKALNTVSEKFREVLILSDVQDLTYEEICEITGLNIGTVKSRLNRGRHQLQELLKDVIKEF